MDNIFTIKITEDELKILREWYKKSKYHTLDDNKLYIKINNTIGIKENELRK